MPSQVHPALIGDLIDAYVEWREECLSLEDAYTSWSSGSLAERDLAFVAYRAALDREQQACSVYAARCHENARESGAGRPESGLRGWLWRLGRAPVLGDPAP